MLSPCFFFFVLTFIYTISDAATKMPVKPKGRPTPQKPPSRGKAQVKDWHQIAGKGLDWVSPDNGVSGGNKQLMEEAAALAWSSSSNGGKWVLWLFDGKEVLEVCAKDLMDAEAAVAKDLSETKRKEELKKVKAVHIERWGWVNEGVLSTELLVDCLGEEKQVQDVKYRWFLADNEREVALFIGNKEGSYIAWDMSGKHKMNTKDTTHYMAKDVVMRVHTHKNDIYIYT